MQRSRTALRRDRDLALTRLLTGPGEGAQPADPADPAPQASAAPAPRPMKPRVRRS
ncbi:hypothetical protein ABEG18_06115 [Alsobacter sp. KACC 23698]|uniref:Uncharacterized protein n=1 Tax=Alsobacter sp. KACC 23698 TaxID=3149229 RepID=A0AAU7JIY6_9HYPH